MSRSVLPEPATAVVSPVKIYGVVLGVGAVCALAIAAVFEFTRPIVEQNRIAMKQTAILKVLPAATRSVAYAWDETSKAVSPAGPDASESEVVYAGFDSDGKLVGLAIEAEGMGYQDVIRLMYGYSFKKQAVIGTRVLESRETPGLGDRIETDKDFLCNFEKLDVQLDASGDAVANPIEFVKPAEKSEAWQIDGISGATISSRAIAEMLRGSTAYWVPRVQPLADQFKPESEEDAL